MPHDIKGYFFMINSVGFTWSFFNTKHHHSKPTTIIHFGDVNGRQARKDVKNDVP